LNERRVTARLIAEAVVKMGDVQRECEALAKVHEEMEEGD